MTTPARRRLPSRFKYLLAFGILLIAVTGLALPVVQSSSVKSNSDSPSSKFASPMTFKQFRSWSWLSNIAPTVAGESVALYASDCATTKSVFIRGEIICAKTNGVDLSDGTYNLNWVDSQLNTTNGGTITANPQTFLFAIPTNAELGLWKANIGRTGHSTLPDDPAIIGDPPTFTVEEGAAVSTFAANCTTPKTAFVLGETVCVRVSGLAVNTSFPNRIAWSDPAGFVRSQADLTTDPQTDTFALPASASSLVGGVIVDNRGTWRANVTRNNGRLIGGAAFTVSDPAQAVADVYVQKFLRDPGQPISTGGSVAFRIIVGNGGPDAAQSVQISESVPAGMTLASFSQQSGGACSPAGTGNCTIATLNAGEVAEFTAVFDIGSSAPGTYTTSTSASSSTFDSNNDNNSSSVEFEVTNGGGGSQCTLTCPTSPAPVNNEPGQNGATVDWDGPNNDNVPVATGTSCGAVSVSTTSPAFFSIGTSLITVTTESGEECTFTVTVLDNENPNIGNCPANITVTEDSGTPGSAIVNYATPSATDNSGDVTVTCSQESGSSFTVSGSPHTVTCTASDAAGNTDSCTFTVTVNAASTECTLTPPANITVASDANQCGATVTYDAPTETGTCGTVTCDRASGSFFPGGTTVVTCSDGAGASTSFTVTVNDETAPVPDVDPLPHLTGDCSVTAGVPVTYDPPGPEPPYTVIEIPTATDNCNGSIRASTQDERTYTVQGTYTVTWTYSDASGNTTSLQQQVTVTGNDTEAPVPDVSPLPTITGECEVTVSEAPTATDNCAGTVTGTTTDPLTYSGAGTYTIVWTYDDGAGHTTTQNQTVVVTDTEAPVISCPANISVNNDPGSCSATVNPGTATATDNCNISHTTVVGTRSDNQPLNAPYPVGTTTITWTATDSGNNTDSCDQTVTVTDNENPTISCPANITVNNDAGECGAVVTYTTPVGQDNCASNTVQTAGLPSGSQFPVGTTTNTFEVTDASGNTATCSFTVTVNDAENPVISCPANIVLEPTCPSGAIGNWTEPVGTDNCPGAVTTRTAGPAPGSTFAAGTTTTISYTVNDAHGHSASCSFTVTVKSVLQTIDDLRASVEANQQLTGPQRNGLLSKLDAAKQHIQNGNQNGACAKLADFVNSVQNFINHGDLSAATGNGWINTANNLRNAIGCTNNPCT